MWKEDSGHCKHFFLNYLIKSTREQNKDFSIYKRYLAGHWEAGHAASHINAFFLSQGDDVAPQTMQSLDMPV